METITQVYCGKPLVAVLEAENTFTMGETTHVYQTGEGFVELPGEVWMQARNAGTTRSKDAKTQAPDEAGWWAAM